ncbi:sugar phosphate isomerase/epimerase family protein [Runella slithyformis]|uniref:Xylose isomerase domain-containing protein TIM barrel n=1 Tax=Runella slithyformis (strain ATCC 29530 / DSM 19594 / LMG 11500 / NCIMB 11436 / LSU 4) TaxID=761193 RepID=A0A7U3ZGG6_RUNSL|nr:sugar phosphate isomerase/epimerase family protein [Runella slithyformis]AEI46702.1 Xylose isomerase domain-containing protein TIM barrel [Runella slithyformis DSM 19594]
MLKLGFVSAILADFGYEHVIDFAANHGFSCVEIMCWPSNNADARRYAGVTHIDADRVLTDSTYAHNLIHYAKEKKVTISALGYYPNPLDPDAEKAAFYQAHIRQLIKAAAKLGLHNVNTFIGRDPAKSITENLKTFGNVWPDIVKLAEAHNVKIGIENCPMFFTDDEWPGGKNLATTPAVWDRMFEIIPSPILGLNYDPSHMIWQMMDEAKPIYDYKNRLHHIHLKDAKLYKEKLDRVGIMANPLEYHSPKLPGLGDVNWRKFFAALTDVRYRGPVCIEVEDKAYESSIDDVKEAILTSRNYLRQFLG